MSAITERPAQSRTAASRILTLDYLRGFFIVVIIIDHIWRFPNIFAVFTGEARLWMTAAEGFVLISGLVIGIVRGRKNIKLPFSTVARKLLGRALLLYIWMIIASVVYVYISWNTTISGIPSTPTPVGSWSDILWLIFTMQHPHVWVHFLYLYAIFLTMSVGMLWLLRKNKTWLMLLLSLAIYVAGWLLNIEWMKWQILFFSTMAIGFYFDTIRLFWRTTKYRPLLTRLIIGSTVFTLVMSVISVFLPQLLPAATTDNLATVFSIDTFNPVRVVVALLWFSALLLLFRRILPYLERYTFGILKHFGSMSLTAYILHGAVICLLNAVIPIGDSIFINSLVTFAGIMAVFGLTKLKMVQRIIPR